MIDTPGHVDFFFFFSRCRARLAACDGARLVVDAPGCRGAECRQRYTAPPNEQGLEVCRSSTRSLCTWPMRTGASREIEEIIASRQRCRRGERQDRRGGSGSSEETLHLALPRTDRLRGCAAAGTDHHPWFDNWSASCRWGGWDVGGWERPPEDHGDRIRVGSTWPKSRRRPVGSFTPSRWWAASPRRDVGIRGSRASRRSDGAHVGETSTLENRRRRHRCPRIQADQAAGVRRACSR